jgi:hypothetical protein
MEQGQQIEEEEPVQQESLVLEEWIGDDEEVDEGGFFEVNDVSEEPRDRHGQAPQAQRLARPSPPRPHRVAQAAGKEQRKPAARSAAKVPAKKPAPTDPRFLQIAERKTPIQEGLYVEEFEGEDEESEDSGIGSGSVYVPFPQWMDYMNQVDDPSSTDLRFNVPLPGMQGDAKDIFTHLTQHGKENSANPSAAVEAIAKRIQNSANVYRR